MTQYGATSISPGPDGLTRTCAATSYFAFASISFVIRQCSWHANKQKTRRTASKFSHISSVGLYHWCTCSTCRQVLRTTGRLRSIVLSLVSSCLRTRLIHVPWSLSALIVLQYPWISIARSCDCAIYHYYPRHEDHGDRRATKKTIVFFICEEASHGTWLNEGWTACQPAECARCMYLSCSYHI